MGLGIRFTLTFTLLCMGANIWSQNPLTQAVPTSAGGVRDSSIPASTPARPDGMVIGVGDLLHVSLLGAPEFERDVRVDDSGAIALPMAGELRLAGLSTTDAEHLVQQRLTVGGFYVDPQVSILVKEYATQGISVLGEVQKPGIYPLIGSHTLFDAISAAGGTTPKASRAVTITHRGSPKESTTVLLSYAPEDAELSNVKLRPGDTVVVGKAGMVYVVGDVRQPTAIVLESSGLTVLQAIAMAQGTNGTAALNKSKLIRRGPNGIKEIPVPLKKILGAKVADVSLEAEDVLFVPNSLAKNAAVRTLDTALRTVSGVIIYGARPY